MTARTDRELLELAAKAAGIDGVYSPRSNAIVNEDGYWMPLNDDGDALRLAAKLELEVLVFHGYGEVWADSLDGTVRGIAEFTDDRATDYRRAIVEAAASIGESLP